MDPIIMYEQVTGKVFLSWIFPVVCLSRIQYVFNMHVLSSNCIKTFRTVFLMNCAVNQSSWQQPPLPASFSFADL